MSLIQITDNSRSKVPDSDKASLLKIADIKIGELSLEDNPNLLVFPRDLHRYGDEISENCIISMRDDEISTGNIMGFVGVNDTQLDIKSRFAKVDEDDYFLHYMLQKVFSINLFDIKHTTRQEDIFDFLLYLFPHFLKKALAQGLFKKYRRFEYNDANIRGPIDVNRHIRENIPFRGTVAYSTREHSYDNEVTQLVRHAIEYIRTKEHGAIILNNDPETRSCITQITLATQSYNVRERMKVINQNLRPIRHPYFSAYTDLQNLCLRILRHESLKYGHEKDKVYGVLFDGAWLWEEYVSSLIDDVFFHPMNKGGTGAQRLFDGNVGLIYPDFISRDNETRIIADAKYKPIDNIGNKDYLQVLAYMFRFDAKAGYYLYPEAAGTADRRLWMNKGSTYEANVAPRDDICLTKHGLKIPVDAENYEMFVFQMKVSEAEFRQVFAAR